ncbi:MAG: DNRLRE domain-containing protein [Verrucomicrobiales bacterium]
MNREYINRSLDGQLTGEEWDALRREVVADPELRREYVEKRWLHAQLETEGESLQHLLADRGAPQPGTSQPGTRLRWVAVAAGIGLLLGLGAFLTIGREAAPTMVATLVQAEGCRWEGSELPTKEGARLGVGTLALAQGMATIRFDSGATVTLEAPSVLEVSSEMRCRLVEGSVVADVPESAHGFAIDTDKMEVVDLGTKFGVTTSAVGGSHVFVFDGEVTVNREEMLQPRHLLSGKSLHFGANIPSSPDEEVARVAPPAPTVGTWKAFSTETGRGRDAYIRRGESHSPTGSDPLLMVKHTDLAPGNERRAVLTFDLSGLAPSAVESARLALKVESSGLGFSSLVPHSRFAVYGALDPSLGGWNENRLRWPNAAAFAGEPLDPSRFERLAEFDIPKGSSHDLVEISSEALVRFLRRREDGLATLVLVRETGESDKQGLVHAFASKEHPTSPAPTLWIRTDPVQ